MKFRCVSCDEHCEVKRVLILPPIKCLDGGDAEWIELEESE